MNITNLPLPFYFFVLGVVVLLLKRKSIKSPLFVIFRVLFPSWRFFEKAGRYPVLLVRHTGMSDKLGAWEPCLLSPKRNLTNFFINPQGQVFLAYNSLLHQLANELQNLDSVSDEEVASSVSYQLVENLVRNWILARGLDLDKVQYQFKIEATSPQEWVDESGDLLLSPIYREL